MIIKPEKPVTDSVARIWFDYPAVKALLPEVNDRFRKVVKGLNYFWDGAWIRYITEYSGQAGDRMAELATELLSAGFIVDLPDEVANLVLEGTFEPEPRSWITRATTGRYKGRFRITWLRVADLYEQARRLPGARYSNGAVYVPPERFAEVEDFALEHGCGITKEAQKLFEEASAKLREAVLFSSPASRKRKKTQKQSDPAEIPDELRDEPL